jgi:hypothetical protein
MTRFCRSLPYIPYIHLSSNRTLLSFRYPTFHSGVLRSLALLHTSPPPDFYDRAVRYASPWLLYSFPSSSSPPNLPQQAFRLILSELLIRVVCSRKRDSFGRSLTSQRAKSMSSGSGVSPIAFTPTKLADVVNVHKCQLDRRMFSGT